MMKILIVDDEENIRLLYQNELKEYGYETVAAATAGEARQLFLQGDISLVILDLKLSGPDDGLEILKWLRHQNRTLPIIISSGYPSYKEDFTTWLADEYILKSARLDELLAAVDRIMKLKE